MGRIRQMINVHGRESWTLFDSGPRNTYIVPAVEGVPISTHAMVIDHIDKDVDGKQIEVLFGALAIRDWGIRLIPEHEKLDMSHYPSEFVEFSSDT